MAVAVTHPVADADGVLVASNGASGSADDDNTKTFLIKNGTATAEVMLGSSGDMSWPWAADDGPLTAELEPGESLYASATVNQTLHVLAGGR